ncbi:MAG: ABC transporter permease, partial [Alphaproteobacteria bacterium]|nr:ABC transporter permease [Alphaproteobacteria bacterium]MDX5417539.1 ABC transporter permease [Alphaproteobacteria bacterium]MDX5495021.1 ABC transporter permease [Alphaproteobacteria bacterium]
MENWKNSARAFWASIAPPTFWLVAFFIIPLSLIWLYSFSSKTGIVEITLDWNLQQYARALEPVYLGIFWKSIWMAAATTAICLVVAFPVAIAIVFAK